MPEADPVRVLLASADASVRQLFRRLLEHEGLAVEEARDGAETLARVSSEPPDVIVMDAVMPGPDGLECARRIKADPATRGVPIIGLSEGADAGGVVAAIESGADECLTTPFVPAELILRVRTMVRLGRELRRSNEVRGEQSRALGILADFACANAEATSLDDVLDRTVLAAVRLLCCRCAAVLLPDSKRRTLAVARSLGFGEPGVDDLSVPVGSSASGEAFVNRTPVVITTDTEHRRGMHGTDAMLLTGVPAIAIPLCAPDRVVGVLTLTGRQNGQPFSPADLEYLTLIVNMAAAAIYERQTCHARDEARHSIVIALAKLAEHRDTDTGMHLERVSRYCVLLARELQMVDWYRPVITDDFLDDLARAVPLHDIGKVAIPDSILLKPGPLTQPEIDVMRSHAEIGARTIRSVIERVPDVGFLCMAEQIAESHHEWFNGEGYPGGARRDDIPLAARIAAVADVYDAITTRRVYKPALPHDEAVRVVAELRGRQFDPDIVDAFLRCADDFRRLADDLQDDVPLVDTHEVACGLHEVVAASSSSNAV